MLEKIEFDPSAPGPQGPPNAPPPPTVIGNPVAVTGAAATGLGEVPKGPTL
tara:strand:- start:26 stop:178 length:153 start_codon:yes stop_codon:yes gene_type:complete